MYRIRKSIDIDFAHHIRGHGGACIHIHGHTWKFEVVLAARTLDEDGFVIDFKRLKQGVLEPCHALLDHSLAIGAQTFDEVATPLAQVGTAMVGSRMERHGRLDTSASLTTTLGGAENRWPGGMKVAVFPFSPTSERLAHWLWQVADAALADDRVIVELARVYETLHPVESVAEFSPDR
jgi:6-pyruvoyl tetrahydropterin synthase/QueD family protein